MILMASAGVISAEVTARIDSFVSGLNTCTQRARSFANSLDDRLGGKDYFAPLRESAQGLSKDLMNITSGIIIAQTFYSILNAAQAAAGAIWQYADSLNAAQVSFGNLFGNYDLASEFVSVLQEYATRSPFNFSDVEAAARSLSAYGIEAENMMFVIEGIGNLAAVTGNYSETFNRVARAIGQINTRGKLMGEEMRQLAEAGLDVDAVYQRLGISAGEVAKANIGSAEAINAIVDVLNESYGDAVTAANTTMQGILANTRDLALSIISSMIQPIYDAVHSMLYTISLAVNQFQALFNEGGLGNAIAKMFGPDVLAILQNFLAVIVQLGQSILQVLYPALRIAGQAVLALIIAFTPVIAVVSQVLSVIGNLANFLLNNAVAMRVLQGVLLALATAFVATRVAAAGMMIIQVISKVIGFFSTIAAAASQALAVMSMYLQLGASAAVAAGKGWVAFASALNVNPLILAISVIAALVAALVGLRSLLGGVSNVAANMSSFDPKNFLGSIPAASGDINKFNNRLSDTNSQLNDMADGLNNAGKAAEKAVEGLLSFDEVFSLPDQNDPTLGGGGLGDIGDVGDVDIPDFGDIGAGIPDVPIFDWDDLLGYGELNGVWEKIKKWFQDLKWSDIAGFISSGLTAALATIGFDKIANFFVGLFTGAITKESVWSAVTNPATWKTILRSLRSGITAALMSMGFDFVFDTIAGMLRDAGADMAGEIIDAISGPLANGLAVGLVTRNPFLAIGAALTSALFQAFEGGLSDGDWSGFATTMLATIGTYLTKALGGGLKGGLLGIGSVIVDLLFGAISDSLDQTGDTKGAEVADKVGTILSTTLSGAAIGMAFGPIGAAVGAAVGAILGTIMAFWNEIVAWWQGTAWPAISNLGASIGSVFTDITTNIQTWWGQITGWFNETWGPFWQNLSDLFGTIFGGIPTIFQDIWNVIGTFFGGSAEEFRVAWETLWSDLRTIGENIWQGISDTFWSFIDGLGGTIESALDIAGQIKDNITNFFSNAWEWIKENGVELIEGFWEGVTSAWDNFWAWVSTVPEKIGSIFTGAGSWLLNAGSEIVRGLWNGLTNMWNNFWSWLGTLPSKIQTIFSGAGNWLWSAGSSAVTGLWNGAVGQFNSFLNELSRWPSLIMNMFSGAGNWLWNAGWNVITGFWNGAVKQFNNFLREISGWGRIIASWKGPEAYDRKLLVPNGEWIMSGLQKSMEGRFPDILDAMHGLGPMMAEAFSEPRLTADDLNIQQPAPNNRVSNQTTVANPFYSGAAEQQQMPTMYVHTLVANKQALRELQKQLNIVSAEGNRWS